MKKFLFIVGIAVLMSGCAATKESVTNGKYSEDQLVTSDSSSKQETVNEIYRVTLFFGLSIPNGGAISLNDWEIFQNEQISQTFEGYNIVDSTGFYKGKPERSKIATFIVGKKDILKLKELAKSYAQQFQQESVMMVVVP